VAFFLQRQGRGEGKRKGVSWQQLSVFVRLSDLSDGLIFPFLAFPSVLLLWFSSRGWNEKKTNFFCLLLKPSCSEQVVNDGTGEESRMHLYYSRRQVFLAFLSSFLFFSFAPFLLCAPLAALFFIHFIVSWRYAAMVCPFTKGKEKA